MNTPSHAIINLFILRDRGQPKIAAAVVVGAVLPDVAMVGFYAWHLTLGTPESIIWSTEYYKPIWQAFFDFFNSVPLMTLGALIAWRISNPILLFFFASMLLHALGDIGLHVEDAHRHFYPFSDWRFVSPFSYWNPEYHGNWISLIEFCLSLAAAVFLIVKSPTSKKWVVGLLGIYITYLVYVSLVWN
ncbi:MAG: hypothetical protein AAF434_01470 [Pseudomonadota bacterium]